LTSRDGTKAITSDFGSSVPPLGSAGSALGEPAVAGLPPAVVAALVAAGEPDATVATALADAALVAALLLLLVLLLLLHASASVALAASSRGSNVRRSRLRVVCDGASNIDGFPPV